MEVEQKPSAFLRSCGDCKTSSWLCVSMPRGCSWREGPVTASKRLLRKSRARKSSQGRCRRNSVNGDQVRPSLLNSPNPYVTTSSQRPPAKHNRHAKQKCFIAEKIKTKVTTAITRAAESVSRQETRLALSLPRRSHYLPPLLLLPELPAWAERVGKMKVCEVGQCQGCLKRNLQNPRKTASCCRRCPLSTELFPTQCGVKNALGKELLSLLAMARAQQFQPYPWITGGKVSLAQKDPKRPLALLRPNLNP